MARKNVKQLGLILFIICCSMDCAWSDICSLKAFSEGRLSEEMKRQLLEKCPMTNTGQWNKESCETCRSFLVRTCQMVHANVDVELSAPPRSCPVCTNPISCFRPY